VGSSRQEASSSQALAARCCGCCAAAVLGAQTFLCPCFLSLCQKCGSNGSVSGYSGLEEPLCTDVCWLCSPLDLLAPLLLKESKCGFLDSQDRCLVCIQPGVYHPPQVLSDGFPTQLLASRPLEALAPPDVSHPPRVPPTGGAVRTGPQRQRSLQTRSPWLRTRLCGPGCFPRSGVSAASRSLQEEEQTSRLWEMLGLAAAVSQGYLSLAAHACVGSPGHQPAAWSPLFLPLTSAVLWPGTVAPTIYSHTPLSIFHFTGRDSRQCPSSAGWLRAFQHSTEPPLSA